MVTISYEALNDLVHEVGEAISKTTGMPVETFDLVLLNNHLSNYLGGEYGVLFEDEENMPPVRVRPDGPETAEGGLIGQQPY